MEGAGPDHAHRADLTATGTASAEELDAIDAEVQA